MNEELPASANRLPPCFFILHSAFFICFWKPTAATVPLKATVRLAQWAAAQNRLSLVTLPALGFAPAPGYIRRHKSAMTQALEFDLKNSKPALLTGLNGLMEFSGVTILPSRISTLRLFIHCECFTAGCSSRQRSGRLISRTCWRIALLHWKRENA
jgi:hypothetical protein